MGAGGTRSEKVDCWKRSGFVSKYVRNLVAGLSEHRFLMLYSAQCNMALAQGIKYLCESPTRILDAGCGPAIRTVEMQATYMRDSIVVGCDYSDEMLQHAERIMANLPPDHRVRVDKADAYELPYETDSFDVVYSYGLLMGLREPERALSEVMRVSRTGYVSIEETSAAMDDVQRRHFSEYKDRIFPGRVYWHDYLSLTMPYKNAIFTRIPTDCWLPEGDSLPEHYSIPPAYARMIVVK